MIDKWQLLNEGKWRTKHGNIVRIRNMEEEHLENLVRLLGKKNPHDKFNRKAKAQMSFELYRRNR